MRVSSLTDVYQDAAVVSIHRFAGDPRRFARRLRRQLIEYGGEHYNSGEKDPDDNPAPIPYMWGGNGENRDAFDLDVSEDVEGLGTVTGTASIQGEERKILSKERSIVDMPQSEITKKSAHLTLAFTAINAIIALLSLIIAFSASIGMPRIPTIDALSTSYTVAPVAIGAFIFSAISAIWLGHNYYTYTRKRTYSWFAKPVAALYIDGEVASAESYDDRMRKESDELGGEFDVYIGEHMEMFLRDETSNIEILKTTFEQADIDSEVSVRLDDRYVPIVEQVDILQEGKGPHYIYTLEQEAEGIDI